MPQCERCQLTKDGVDYYTIDGRTDDKGNAIGVPLCPDCVGRGLCDPLDNIPVE